MKLLIGYFSQKTPILVLYTSATTCINRIFPKNTLSCTTLLLPVFRLFFARKHPLLYKVALPVFRVFIFHQEHPFLYIVHTSASVRTRAWHASFATTTTQYCRASVRRKNTENVNVLVSKWIGHGNECRMNAIIDYGLAWKHGHVVAAVLSYAQLCKIRC